MHVRQAKKSDKEGIIKQARAFLAASPMASHVDFDVAGFDAFIDRAQESSETQIWVLDNESEIVGIAGAVAYPLYFAPSKTVVQELFWWIEPSKRGTTASRQMIFEIESWAEQIGASHVFMIALENERASTMERVYSRQGFLPIERTFTKEIGYGH